MSTPPSPPGTVSTFALSALFAIALCAAALVPPIILGWAAYAARNSITAGEGILLLGAGTILGGAPFVAGLIAWAWTVDPHTARGRRSFRVLAAIIGACVAAASTTLIGTALTTTVVSAGSAVLLSAGSAAVSAGSIWVGTLVRARIASRAPRVWTPDYLTPAYTRKALRRVAWVFFITLLGTSILAALPGTRSGDWLEAYVGSALAASALPFFAATLAGIYMSGPLTAQATQMFNGDAGLQKTVTTAVFHGMTAPRTPVAADASTSPREESGAEIAAARYAQLMARLYPLQFLQGACVLVGITLTQVSALRDLSSSLHLYNAVLVALAVAVSVVAAVSGLRRWQRIRRYRDTHHVVHNPTAPPVDDTPEIGVNKKT
jgi:hypothetical protein